MTKPSSRRSRRRVLAVVLAAVGIGLVVVEPFPKGAVLVSFTETHGIDASDLPAIVLLLVAAWCAM
jgi:O-antigen ligase